MSEENKELKALIKLLDDSDPEILDHIRKKLISLGAEAIPVLEAEWGRSFDPLIQHRIEHIVHAIQFEILVTDFIAWQKSLYHDLLEGMMLVARINYPDLNEQKVRDQLHRLYEMAHTETGLVQSPLEKIQALNRVMFEFAGFRGNTSNFHSPQNSFINTVLESKKGNPLMLSVIYMLVAQRCNIPVFGVNLPEHFICAYQERNPVHLTEYAYPDADIVCYINPFSRGNVFGKDALDEFLQKLNLEPQESFFIPCRNEDIILRSLRNLENSFRKTGEFEKQNEVNGLIQKMNPDTR
jgi:regulator of sirC expression with transglutaminase-like and TPR domain